MNDGGDEYDEEDLADSRTVKIASERVASQIQEAERNSRCEQEEYDDCTESKVHRAVFKSTSACPALRKRIFFPSTSMTTELSLSRRSSNNCFVDLGSLRISLVYFPIGASIGAKL